MRKHLLQSILIVGLGAVLSSCSFNSMFYYPSKTLDPMRWPAQLSHEEVLLSSTDSNQIHGLFIKPLNNSKAVTVLMLHGNGGNVTTWLENALPLAMNGYQVFLIDYQGYGKSEGEATHEGVLDDAEAALRYVAGRDDVKHGSIVVAGLSLGGHLAVILTNRNQDIVDALLIEGAFTSHNSVATHFTPWYGSWFTALAVSGPYSAIDEIADIKVRKLIIHSRADETIPFEMGQELFERAAEPKEFWEISGTHTDGILLFTNEYLEKVQQLTGE